VKDLTVSSRVRPANWRRSRCSIFASIGLLGLVASAHSATTVPGRSSPLAFQLPLTFEVNQGQTDSRVEFLARGPGYDLFLTPTEAVLALPRSPAKGGPRPVVRMQLVGSAGNPRVQGIDALPGKVSYFRGRNVEQWKTQVPTFRQVRYSAVYPGIDLVYYGKHQQLEYDFIVAPGADPGSIELAFAGAQQTTVDAQGDLVLETANGALRFQKPVIFQLDGRGRRRPVEGGYVVSGRKHIGFRVGAYDRTRPLIIDPVLSYSTYLGGSGSEGGASIAVDATGAMYVTGRTTSADFPVVNPAQPANASGSGDLYVAKLTPDGTALIYATYLGGSDFDFGADIAVDAAGAAYVAGQTSSADFPTVNAFQPALCGDRDVVIVKLSADGSRLVYSTYLGGNSSEYGGTIAVDLAGAAYVAAATGSLDFPVVNAFQSTSAGGGDAFVAKLAPDGSALLYSTYLGGSWSEEARDIAVDSLGAAYVVGYTEATPEFPLVNPLPWPAGGYDAFVAKLAPDGARLIYSTRLGGDTDDYGNGIAIDASGAAYVTGYTYSTDFPTTNALQPQIGRYGDADAFVVKIAPEGGSLIFGTYLGGLLADTGSGIAVDTAGAVYVTGGTSALDFPTMNPLQPALAGPSDAFLSKLSPDGSSLVYSTYLGGSARDGGGEIAVDLAGAVYIGGQTGSLDFPTTPAALQPLFGGDVCAGGDSDAFVVKITDDSLAMPLTASNVQSPATGSTATQRGGGGAMNAPFLVSLALFVFAATRRRFAGRARAHAGEVPQPCLSGRLTAG
jgi:hypothetical protein